MKQTKSLFPTIAGAILGYVILMFNILYFYKIISLAEK